MMIEMNENKERKFYVKGDTNLNDFDMMNYKLGEKKYTKIK